MNIPTPPQPIDQQTAASEKESLEAIAASSGAESPLYDFLFDAGLRAFAPHMKGERVLELGAGSGNFTQKLLARARAVDVVEGSTLICEKLHGLGLANLTVYDSLFEHFMPERRYTDVIASFVNEHVIAPLVIYEIARRALQPGGHLFLIVPNREAQSRQLAKAMGLVKNLDDLTPADLKNGHRRTYAQDDFLQEIADNGFSTVAHGGLILKPFADFQLHHWLKIGQLETAHLQGLEKLGHAYPRLCQALYAVAAAK